MAMFGTALLEQINISCYTEYKIFGPSLIYNSCIENFPEPKIKTPLVDLNKSSYFKVSATKLLNGIACLVKHINQLGPQIRLRENQNLRISKNFASHDIDLERMLMMMDVEHLLRKHDFFSFFLCFDEQYFKTDK